MRAELESKVYTWHALEAACCMGETWAMRAELESKVYMACIRSCLLYG